MAPPYGAQRRNTASPSDIRLCWIKQKRLGETKTTPGNKRDEALTNKNIDKSPRVKQSRGLYNVKLTESLKKDKIFIYAM